MSNELRCSGGGGERPRRPLCLFESGRKPLAQVEGSKARGESRRRQRRGALKAKRLSRSEDSEGVGVVKPNGGGGLSDLDHVVGVDE